MSEANTPPALTDHAKAAFWEYHILTEFGSWAQFKAKQPDWASGDYKRDFLARLEALANVR